MDHYDFIVVATINYASGNCQSDIMKSTIKIRQGNEWEIIRLKCGQMLMLSEEPYDMLIYLWPSEVGNYRPASGQYALHVTNNILHSGRVFKQIANNVYELWERNGFIHIDRAARYVTISLCKLRVYLSFQITVQGEGDGRWGKNIGITLVVTAHNETFEWFALTQHKQMTIPHTFLTNTVIVIKNMKTLNIPYNGKLNQFTKLHGFSGHYKEKCLVNQPNVREFATCSKCVTFPRHDKIFARQQMVGKIHFYNITSSSFAHESSHMNVEQKVYGPLYISHEQACKYCSDIGKKLLQHNHVITFDYWLSSFVHIAKSTLIQLAINIWIIDSQTISSITSEHKLRTCNSINILIEF